MAGRIGYNGSDKWKLKATELLNEGGGGGTDDYDDLENKPKINNVELSGNKTAAELGMYTKSEVDTNLAGKMDLNATSGSISNLDILGNYGIGNVENGGRVYITGWQHKYLNFNFPEIAIASYDAENDAYYRDISMNTAGFMISNLDFDYFGNHGQGSVKTLDVHIDDSQFLIKEGIGDTNIIEVADTGNINVNASHVVFDSDDWISAYAVDGFSFACDDDFEIDAVGIKIASDGITNGRALYVDSNGYLVSSAVTDTELGYLSGVTSAIQTQLNGKQASITGGATTIVSSNLTASRALVSNSSGKVAVSAVTSTELGYLDGVTSAIQTQLDGKVAKTNGLVCKTAASSSAGAVVVTHTETTGTSRYTMFAYGNGNGIPWFMEILYGSSNGSSYVRCILSCNTSIKAGVRLISSTQFAIVCGSWDSVYVCENDDTFSVATASDTYTIDTSVTYQPVASDSYKLGGSSADTAATANTVAKRQGNGYLYATYFNTSAGSENPASYTAYPAFIDSNGWLRKTSIANMKTALGINSKVNNGWTELLAFGSYTSGSKTLSAKITDYAGGIMVARCGASGSSGGSVCGFWPISTGIYSYTSDYFEVSWIEGTNTMKRLTFHFTAANKITIDASINSAALRAIYVLA